MEYKRRNLDRTATKMKVLMVGTNILSDALTLKSKNPQLSLKLNTRQFVENKPSSNQIFFVAGGWSWSCFTIPANAIFCIFKILVSYTFTLCSTIIFLMMRYHNYYIIIPYIYLYTLTHSSS